MAAFVLPLAGKGAGILGSILGAHHAAAVAAEGNDLNAAIPQNVQNLQAIVAAYNEGRIDAPTAIQAVNEATSEYYDAVSGIIKDSSNRGANCTPQDAQGKGSNCNGPCTVGCSNITSWASHIIGLIQSGGGTLNFPPMPALPSHNFRGVPAWSVTISPPHLSAITDNTGIAVSANTSVQSNLAVNSTPLNTIPNNVNAIQAAGLTVGNGAAITVNSKYLIFGIFAALLLVIFGLLNEK